MLPNPSAASNLYKQLCYSVSALLAAVDVNKNEVTHIATNYLDKCQKVLDLYKHAQQILSGLGNNVYPQDEAQWLVSSAWNRAALYLKLQKYENAELYTTG